MEIFLLFHLLFAALLPLFSSPCLSSKRLEIVEKIEKDSFILVPLEDSVPLLGGRSFFSTLCGEEVLLYSLVSP
jgi:hypothetical protein